MLGNRIKFGFSLLPYWWLPCVNLWRLRNNTQNISKSYTQYSDSKDVAIWRKYLNLSITCFIDTLLKVRWFPDSWISGNWLTQEYIGKRKFCHFSQIYWHFGSNACFQRPMSFVKETVKKLDQSKHCCSKSWSETSLLFT